MPQDPLRAERRARWAAQPLGPTPRPARPAGESTPPRKRHIALKIMLAVFLVMATGSGVFGYKIIAASDNISDTDRSILGQLKDLLFTGGRTLEGESEDRINILLLAVGGEGHKGEALADTVMIASLKPKTGEAALLSIPRDLYVQVPGEEYFTKINAVHAYGESQRASNGPALLEAVVEEITGVPVHYYVRVDFTAFKSIVDAVGGVNVTINNSFYDYWHKISFPAGTEKMNGERALAYVRARYIEGPEGGDFKRAARQQQALLALREKVFSVQTALDFTRANAILDSLSENIRTNLQLWEMKRFYELGRLIKPDEVHSVVLSTGPQGVLTGGTELLGGTPASVLRPRTGNWGEIQQVAQNIFATPTVPDSSTPPATPPPAGGPTPTPTPAVAVIEIRNGTAVTGLAARYRDQLEESGFEVSSIGNAATRNLTQTSVFLINQTREDAAKKLAEQFSVAVQTGIPAGETSTNADVLIILGNDADN